jgi:hypothetical protein
LNVKHNQRIKRAILGFNLVLDFCEVNQLNPLWHDLGLILDLEKGL